MSDVPETVTLEWVAQKLVEIQHEQHATSERLDQFEHRLQNIEAELFRNDARRREMSQRLQEAGDILVGHLSRRS